MGDLPSYLAPEIDRDCDHPRHVRRADLSHLVPVSCGMDYAGEADGSCSLRARHPLRSEECGLSLHSGSDLQLLHAGPESRSGARGVRISRSTESVSFDSLAGTLEVLRAGREYRSRAIRHDEG